jgi:hypothetical protein
VRIDNSVPEDDGEAIENKSGVEFGPHPKFTRGYEKYALEKEMKMVTEKRVIFSLDLLLDIFTECCQFPGCTDIPPVKHHFVGNTLIVNCSCNLDIYLGSVLLVRLTRCM